nr:uncharacterized protein LOC104117334 [Nicotiana tomentosiformis]
MQRDTTLQISKYKPTHTWKEWNYENRTITSSFIARKYLKEIKSNNSWSLLEFRDRVSLDLRAKVTLSQAKRAKMKVIALIDGDIKDQYKMIWDYCIEIDRTNRGSTIHMKFTDNEVPNKPYRFQRIYICFVAYKKGYKAGCRKIIGVDGCWLKGPMYGTQLLSAVGIDGNNNIFPIAYAIAEKESRETWVWFLNYLAVDLDIDESGWTFMSDKQKVFWAAAKAATVEEFDACMCTDDRTTAGEYIPQKSNKWNYEIIGATIRDNWAVDLKNRTYSYRKWSIMGISCKHAIASIWAKKDDILDYVDDCYKVETYGRIYEYAILPINGPQLWAKSTKIPPWPPEEVAVEIDSGWIYSQQT